MTRGPWLLLALAGCGPSVPQLVAGRHYREAVCAAHDGDGDARLVGAALDRDAEVFVHVHAVARDELPRAVVPAADALLARARLVRVQVRSNSLPVDGVLLGVALRGDDPQLAGVPLAWDSLAWATRETLPPRRRESTVLTGDNVLRGLAAIFSGGTTLLMSAAIPALRFRSGYAEVDAPVEEYERLAPVATSLQEAFRAGGCHELALPAGRAGDGGHGQECEAFFVLDATREARWTLEVTTDFMSLRDGARPGSTRETDLCRVRRRATVALGATAALAAETRAHFGPRMRALVEVAGP